MDNIEKANDNIYLDLDIKDAEDMYLKSKLVLAIKSVLATKNLTQEQLSKLVHMPQPKVSNMLNGKFRGISEAKMLYYLTMLNQDIQITMQPTKHQKGEINLMLASSC